MSKQTGSFVAILLIAAVGGAVALRLHNRTLADVSSEAQTILPATHTPRAQAQPKPEVSGETDEPPVDTTGWKTYTSRNYAFEFKYPAAWKVTPTPTTEEFDLLTIIPGDKTTPIHIFLSKKGYIGLEDVKTEPIDVSGQTGVNVQQALVGVEYNKVFYTFDLGNAVKDKPQFKALVGSVVFGTH